KLVAATTPAGVGVWSVGLIAHDSQVGTMIAVNGPAKTTTGYGASIAFNPIDQAQIGAAEACLP
ncbi:MAG: hypothetical protein QOE25_1113, partial [Actinomycetota bacterium]|nr:hypothetical protein [Actinomycetota bacterium]